MEGVALEEREIAFKIAALPGFQLSVPGAFGTAVRGLLA